MSPAIEQLLNKVSNLRSDNYRLRDELRVARERVKNIERDLSGGLVLNRDHLWDIIEEIDNALNQREKQNA